MYFQLYKMPQDDNFFTGVLAYIGNMLCIKIGLVTPYFKGRVALKCLVLKESFIPTRLPRVCQKVQMSGHQQMNLL